MLFPKDKKRQKEYMLVKVGLNADKMDAVFQKLGGVKALAKCRSVKEIFAEITTIQKTDWPLVCQMVNYFSVMNQDEKMAKQISLNKTAFLIDKKIRKEKGKADINAFGNRMQNDTNYKELWRKYRGVAHLIVAFEAMKLDFLEKDNPNKIPFEVFVALNLAPFLRRAYNECENLSKLIEPRLKQPIVPTNEVIKIKKVDIPKEDTGLILMPEVCHIEDMKELETTLSSYRAPVSL